MAQLVRVLELKLKGCYFESHRQRSRYVVFLSKTLYLLPSSGPTQEDLSRHD